MSDVLDRVRATGLVGGPIVVLLSGGRDSVCLLDICVELGAAVRALHVNYGLRDEANDDEELCRSLGERLGVALAWRRPGPAARRRPPPGTSRRGRARSATRRRRSSAPTWPWGTRRPTRPRPCS